MSTEKILDVTNCLDIAFDKQKPAYILIPKEIIVDKDCSNLIKIYVINNSLYKFEKDSRKSSKFFVFI